MASPAVDYDALAKQFGGIDADEVRVDIPENAPGGQKQQLAYKNNNPGNLRNPDGSWKTFKSPSEGYQALQDYVGRHAVQGHTLESYISTYAPPNENDTEAYIKNATERLGVDRKTPLSTIDQRKLAAFQADQESNTVIYHGDQPLDYNALARRFGATDLKDEKPVDYDALAAKFAGVDPSDAPGAPGMYAPQLPLGLRPSVKAAPGQIQSTIPAIRNLPPLTEKEYLERVAGQGPTPEFGLGPTITGGLESALGARSVKTGTTIAGEPISRVRGAAQAISGAVEATTPAMVPGIAAAPLEAVFISGISSLSAEGAQKALKMLDAGEDYQELGSVLGGLGGAALAGFGPRIAGDYLFRRMLRAALQDKVNADFRAREAAEREANKPRAVEEPPQPKPKKPPEDIQEAEFEDIPSGPKGGPTPAAAEPEPRVTPPPTEVVKGSTFETPTGKFTVTDITKGRVKYEKETPGGQIVPGTLPLNVFQGMVARLATPPAVAPTAEQPAAAQAEQPPATTVQIAPEDVDKTPAVANQPQVAPQAQPQLVPVESVKPGVRRVTGSADAALNDAGKETAADLKKEYGGKFDIVYAGPMSRTQDTAAGIAPQVNIDERLGPMELGSHEGEEEESQRDAIHKRMREAPDEPFPGVSKFTGTPGETTNRFTNDVVEQAQEQRAQLAANPDLKILNVTHGRNMRALEAWAKAGFPEDRSVDVKEMTADGDHWSNPGVVYGLTSKGMKELKGDPEPGIPYYVRHGETDFSSAGKGKAASTSARELEGKPEAPPRPAIEPTGKSAEVYTTKGTKVNIAYDVRESGDLQNSFEDNYPQELQPRDTSRKASRQRVDQRKADMNGALMADSRLASDGAPIALKTGTVVTRNHGTQALRELYAEKNPRAAEYKQWLTGHAQEFGLNSAKIAAMKEPVLVRVLTDDLPHKEVVKLAEEANAPSTARMSDAEVAASLAKKMTGVLMDSFDPTEDGRPNVEFVRELIKDLPVEEQAVFMDRDGKLSQTGARIIRNVVFAKAYPDPRALERMAESESPTLKNLTSGMLAAAPDVAKLQEAVARGDRYDLGLGPEIADAASVMDGLIREGTPLNVWLAQGDMFGRDPAVEKLVQIFSENRRSSKRIGGFLKEYTEVAEAAGSPKQAGMFGPPEPPEKIDAIEAAYQRAQDKWQAQRDLFAAPGTQPESGGVAPQEGGAAGVAEEDYGSPDAVVARPKLEPSLPFYRPDYPKSADAQYEALIPGKPGHVYLNGAAQSIVRGAMAKGGLSDIDFLGLTIGFNQARVIIQQLHEMEAENPHFYEAINRVASAVEQAIADMPIGKRYATLVVAGPEVSNKNVRQTRKEEEFHRQQLQRNPGNASENHVDVVALRNNPAAAKALDAIHRRWPHLSDQDAALELGATLGTGRGQEFGLTAKEGEEAFLAYYNHVVARHGDEMKGLLNYADAKLRRAHQDQERLPEGQGRELGRPRNGENTDRPTRKGGQDENGESGSLVRQREEESGSLFGDEIASPSQQEAQHYEDKLLGDRLTAQFHAPVSREEQVRKLRKGVKPPQGGLFEEATPPPQGDLFGGERGSLPVTSPGIGRTLRSIGSPSALTRSAVGARSNAIKALHSAMDEESDRHFGQKIRTFVTGERDVRIAETNQLRDQLRELLPDHIDQEALTLMRDFKNRPGELEEFLDGSHPFYQTIPEAHREAAVERVQKLRPIIERVLDPTPEMHGADEALTHYFAEHLAEGRQLGFLDSEIANEEYITHVVQPAEKGEKKSRIGQLFPGKLGPRRFRFGKQRFYPTILHALAGGAKVRTLNGLDALGVYGEKYATTAAYHLLLNVLKGSAAGKWGSYAQQKAGAIPADWVELAPESRTFRHEIPFTTAEGQPGVAHQTLFVPPNVEEAMRPILDPNYANRLPGFQRGRVYQAYIKMVQLGLSVFHLKALQLTALGNEGPTGVLATYLSDMKSPEFLDAERSWIRAGLTTPVLGKTIEVYMAMRPSSLPTTADVIRGLPIVKQADKLASAVSHLTFGIVQRKMKVVDASLQYAAWLAKHPTATPEGQFEAQRLIAKQVNATYGGLNWENLGINRMTRELARALLLAPDWTYSNILNLQYAAEGGPAGRAARIFWIRSIIFGLALTAGMSLLISKKTAKDPTRVLLGKDKEGHDLTDNVNFVGAPGDLSTLLHNVQRYGAPVGLARSIVSKFGPFARAGIHLATDADATGRPIIPKTTRENILGQKAPAHKPTALEKTALGVKETVKEIAPVPFSVSTIARMLADQKHHYSMGQYAEAVMSGRQPQAQATGTR